VRTPARPRRLQRCSSDAPAMLQRCSTLEWRERGRPAALQAHVAGIVRTRIMRNARTVLGFTVLNTYARSGDMPDI
jgi:hypothetical protein